MEIPGHTVIGEVHSVGAQKIPLISDTVIRPALKKYCFRWSSPFYKGSELSMDSLPKNTVASLVEFKIRSSLFIKICEILLNLIYSR